MINTDENIKKYFNQFVNKSSSLKSLTKTQEIEVLDLIFKLAKELDKRWIPVSTPPEKAKLVLVRRTSGDILTARRTNEGWYCYHRNIGEDNPIQLQGDPIVEWQDLPQDKNEPLEL